jgi:hypothetical protein
MTGSLRPLVTSSLLVALLSAGTARGQDSSAVAVPAVPKVRFSPYPEWDARKIIATSAVAATVGVTLYASYAWWWKPEYSTWRFYRTNWFNGEDLGIDKLAHMIPSLMIFRGTNDILRWGGYEESTSFWWATGVAGFLAVAIEVGDGFSPWGFDYEDLVFNFMGIGYGMLQTKVPFFRNFDLKLGIYPQSGWSFPARFTDYYDAHTAWLTFNMENLLPDPIAEWWPGLIQLGVGYSVDDIKTRREAVFGLDLNLEIFPPPNKDILLLQRILNMWHYPLPAVKFTEDKHPRYYLFHQD